MIRASDEYFGDSVVQVFSLAIQALIRSLTSLPGIGPKSAQRLACHLLSDRGRKKGSQLLASLQDALVSTVLCRKCRIYTEEGLCPLCADTERDQTLLCVVESVMDAFVIEQTEAYRGLYFILHGHLSPLDAVGPDELAIPWLLEYVREHAIRELIIATGTTMEGRATAYYIAGHMREQKVKCTRIAHGVPLGGELEYLDSSTLGHALCSRAEIIEGHNLC